HLRATGQQRRLRRSSRISIVLVLSAPPPTIVKYPRRFDRPKGVIMADRPKPGAIVHVEFHVKEPKKVEKFYESLFGWKFQEVPGMNYSLFQAPSGPAGGIGGLQPGNWQPGVINYILVNSVDEHVEKIKKAGGKIVAPKNEVPGQGWFAILEAPSGIRLGHEVALRDGLAEFLGADPQGKRGRERGPQLVHAPD